MARANSSIARIRSLDLSKYNTHQTAASAPPPGYVLVVDQIRGDASIRHAQASATTFREMLVQARTENPGARIVIKAHPETSLGLRSGHFGAQDVVGNVTMAGDAVSPWRLLDGAAAVYTVSSGMGFEAILAGHRPRVFGQPFYSGWGLTVDENPVPRRTRKLTRTQLFAAAMILAPVWYDPCRDRLCSFEAAVDQLEAETRAFREDRAGHVAIGMRLWKRGRLQAVFGRQKPLIFADAPDQAVARAQALGRNLLIWAGKEPRNLTAPGLTAPGLILRRVEDGFLRSRGLGAALVPPLSLVADDLGIYYDPTRESRLERLILAPLPADGRLRAERLIDALIAARVTKYNLGGAAVPGAGSGRCILVPGQVEDDASILLGTTDVRTNLELLRATRAANPEARVIYKPHPDVEAGLRAGAISAAAMAGLADVVAVATDAVSLIDAVDEVWTMTSLLGFEALLRGKTVTCLGTPFYAGWGLTRDLGAVPERRKRAGDGHPLPRPDMVALVHAALIGYPRYYDPVSHRPCPPEVAVERLASGALPPPGRWLRLLAKLQGRLASHARLWR